MPDSRVVNVHIFGSEYRIGTAGDPDRAREAARLVDRRMREVANSQALRSVAQISVLTAMHLVDELFQAEEEARRVRATASRQADLLANTLDRP